MIKINKIKFIRNIIICVVAVIIVAVILNIATGYKRDKYTDVTNLVLNEKNITENLKNNIYISENKGIYLSKTDIQNLFDANIYYDEKYNQIITTSSNQVANIVINDKKIVLNDSTVNMLEPVIKINDEIYLPISEMEIIYNIDVQYIEETNRVIIDDLNKGMIKADIAEDTEIKFKPRGLSKVVSKISKGETIACFYTTSKGWREIRTKDGIVGYVKANKITNEYIIRQDMEPREEAKEVSIKANGEGNRYINDEKIELIDWDNLSAIREKTEEKLWINILIKKEQENSLLDYKKRTELINNIVNLASVSNASNINLEFDNLENEEVVSRLIIELSPKLRDLGITTSIKLNNMEISKYLQIVDYIVIDK